MYIGKSFLVVFMIISMMMVVVMSEQKETSLSTVNIYSTTDNSETVDKSTYQTFTIAANSTQSATYLFNGQYVSVGGLGSYGWHYYYIDLAPYATLTVTHYTSNSFNNLEIYMENYNLPTTYSYSKKGYMRTYSYSLTSDSKSYSNRVYVGVRNANSVSSTGYTLSIKVTPGYTPTPSPTVIYRNDGLTLGLGVPALILTVALFFTVIAQIRKINALTKRVTELEKKLVSTFPPTEEMMPVMMNVPLMSANSLQQDHEEIQTVVQQPPIIQPPTSQVPQQQPTTIPQLFPQFVQQQALPPQFRNAQPYPFTYPQVVFAQPPQGVQQVSQQTGQAQTKQ